MTPTRKRLPLFFFFFLLLGFPSNGFGAPVSWVQVDTALLSVEQTVPLCSLCPPFLVQVDRALPSVEQAAEELFSQNRDSLYLENARLTRDIM